MKRKFFYSFVFLAITFLIGVSSIFADTGILKHDKFLYYNGTTFETLDTPPSESLYPYFAYKYSEKSAFVCASGLSYQAPIGSSCPIGVSDKNLGVAYLIKEHTGMETGITSYTKEQYENYYWLELSTLIYLGNYNVDVDSLFVKNVYKTKVFPNGKTLEQMNQAAIRYQDKYSNEKYKKDIEIEFSSNDLEFTYNEDGYFYSQKIYINDKNKNAEYIPSLNNSKFMFVNESFTKEEDGKYYFQLRIAKKDISSETESVKVTLKANYEYYTANFYDCSGSSQDLFSTTINKVHKEKVVEATGKISITNLKIKKLDQNGNYLPNAVIKVENEDKTYSKDFTTTNSEIIIQDLPYGTYTVTEISAPNGYVIDSEPKNVVLSSENLVQTVEFKNSLTRVEISKITSKDNKVLSGAVLQIQDKDGNVIKDNNGKEYEWTTTEDAYVIEGLLSGTYYLVEKSAPEGYVLNNEKVKFEIDSKTKVVKLEMKNNLTRVEISKVISKSDKLLKGAVLQIQDKDGNVIKDNNGKEYEWTTTEDAYVIEGLLPGTYYLVEKSAPEGYELNKEKIEFVVDNRTEVVKVKIENNLEVKVPDTLSSRSTLLIAISMFDIALGIGILTYVKKNKVEE